LNGAVPTRGFVPFKTDRLLVRAMERRDITRFTWYRNIPEVAAFQEWDVPFTRDAAHDLLDELETLEGPSADTWVNLAVDDGTGRLLGDVAVGLGPDEQVAMVGYTFAPDAQGRGLATEAVGAVVDRLFDRSKVHRVAATLDPANLASARLLERLGFRYEGCSFRAALVRGRWLDDDRYAVLAEERRAWRQRDLTAPRAITLVDITSRNVRAVTGLGVHHSQERFVPTVAEALAEALHPGDFAGAPIVPWYRAIEVDGDLAGFVMLIEPVGERPVPHLWRLLVDRRQQGRGVGSAAIGMLAARLREQGFTRLSTCWAEGRGGPSGFWRRLGFVPAGTGADGAILGEAELDRLLAG
jgi:RimJ/RimL family protein N-acetyltransferase